MDDSFKKKCSVVLIFSRQLILYDIKIVIGIINCVFMCVEKSEGRGVNMKEGR